MKNHLEGPSRTQHDRLPGDDNDDATDDHADNDDDGEPEQYSKSGGLISGDIPYLRANERVGSALIYKIK